MPGSAVVFAGACLRLFWTAFMPGPLAVPGSALVLAAGAAASFGAGNAFGFVGDASTDVLAVTWLLGWVLLAWAVIAGGRYAVLLGLRLLSRRPVCQVEAALAAASLVLTAVVLTARPPCTGDYRRGMSADRSCCPAAIQGSMGTRSPQAMVPARI